MPCRRVLLREGELEWLELLVAVKVAFEVLQQNNLLIDGLWEFKEVVLAYHFLVLSRNLASMTVNVVEVEEVRMGYNFCRVIEKYAVRAIA